MTALTQAPARAAFWLAKRPAFGSLAGLTFQYCPGIIPVRYVLRAPRIVAFQHPRPSWSEHILIVPRRRIPSLIELGRRDNSAYVTDVLTAAARLIRSSAAYETNYVLCANGGPRQEVRQVHFHLFTGERLAHPFAGAIPDERIYPDQGVAVFHHPTPNWGIHIVIVPQPDVPALAAIASPLMPRHVLNAIVRTIARLDADFGLSARGYTLIVQEHEAIERQRLVVHIVAGRRYEA